MATSRKPWLCRLGWHTSTFLDAGLCFGSLRCNRCLGWLKPNRGAKVEACRRYTEVHGVHRPQQCLVPDETKRKAAEGTPVRLVGGPCDGETLNTFTRAITLFDDRGYGPWTYLLTDERGADGRVVAAFAQHW